MKTIKETTAETTANYEIMFKSAVSMLQSTYTAYRDIQREKFELGHSGWINNEGYYCITVAANNEEYMKDLAEREYLLAQQLQYCFTEVERLRKLKDETD